MFYLSPEGTRHTVGKPFTYNGYYYGTALATPAKFTELGFTQVVVGPRPDDKFYVVSGPDNAGQYSSTPRDLTQLKNDFVRQVKTTAYNFLKATDWYIVRQQELGYSEAPVPASVTAFRASIRSAVDAHCLAINAAADVAALKTLVDAGFAYAQQPDDVTTY